MSPPQTPTSSPSTPPPSGIPRLPPPWKATATTFILPFYVSPSSTLPPQAFSAFPNTSSSPSSLPNTSSTAASPTPTTSVLAAHDGTSKGTSDGTTFHGGPAMLMLVRYRDSPAGPYDELIVMPGWFKKKGKKNMRITGIWVSGKETCWNGRKNWNIPKYLARFKYTPPLDSPTILPTPPTKIEVYPYDPTAQIPFFVAHVQPIKWLPAFPCSMAALSYLGVDTRAVQPPLPEGPDPELCGTDTWKLVNPEMYSRKTRLVWIDMRQPEVGEKVVGVGEGEGAEEGDALLERRGKGPREKNWWPGLRRWHIGLWFEAATLGFDEPEILEG